MLPEEATIQTLRRDLALQLSRAVHRLAVTQVMAAKHLRVPQPTVSKLMNGQVDNLSIELLIRIAVRAGISLTLLTGEVPEEAGAYVSASGRHRSARRKSRLADDARDLAKASDWRLTPTQRLDAFLEHNQLLAELRLAGRVAENSRAIKATRP
jgi:predicted XRE-type DNA-binding protein